MSFLIANFRPYYLCQPGFANTYQYNCSSDSFATCVGANYFADLLNIVQTGDRLLVTSGSPLNGLSFSGTFLNDGSTVSVNWDNTLRFETQMADVSTASTVWFSVPPAGVITQVYGVQWSAVTVASSVVSYSIGSTAITGGSYTVTTSGAAGTAYNATPTAANVTDGATAVKAVTDGGSSTTTIMTVGFKIICPAQI